MSSSGQTDMLEYIDWKAVECLNQKPEASVQNALKQGYREDDGLVLESDTDEQLLIHIPFNRAVKLQSLSIRSLTDGQAPRKIKLFINRPSLGFSEASDFAAVQEFILTEADLKGEKPLQLKYVKFQVVTTLSIFIEDNQGDEETTKVQKIALFGNAGEVFNVSEIQKNPGQEEG